MFDNLTHWQWIAIAWGQLVVAYVAYLLYLRRVERRAREERES